MGQLKHRLGWPATGSIFLARNSVRQSYDTAVQELADTSPIKERLMELRRLRRENAELRERLLDERTGVERPVEDG